MTDVSVVHGVEYRGVMIHILETREAVVYATWNGGERQQFVNKYDAMDFIDVEFANRSVQAVA